MKKIQDWDAKNTWKRDFKRTLTAFCLQAVCQPFKQLSRSPVHSNHQLIWTTWSPIRYKHKPVQTAWSPVCCNRQPFQMTWSPIHWKNQAIWTTWSPNHWKHHSVRTAWQSVHLKHWTIQTAWSPVCPFQKAWSLLDPFEQLELFSMEWAGVFCRMPNTKWIWSLVISVRKLSESSFRS